MIGLRKDRGTYVVPLSLALLRSWHSSRMGTDFLLCASLALDDGAGGDDVPAAFFEVVEPAAVILVLARSRVVVHVRHHFLQVL